MLFIGCVFKCILNRVGVSLAGFPMRFYVLFVICRMVIFLTNVPCFYDERFEIIL